MPSARVSCPYCSAKLRISTEGGLSTRAKCSVCKKTFTPSFTYEAAAQAGPAPSLPAPPVESPLQPIAWTTAPMSGAASAVPPERPAPPLSVPPPPPVDADARQRRREKVHDRPVGQLRPYEVALASALILAVVGGLGFLGYQLYYQPKDGPVDGSGDVTADRSAPVAEPFVVPAAASLALKPRPKRLAGVWELRADDGRIGRLILRPDGTLTASSTAGDSPLPDYNGQWFLLDEDGNRYVIEFSRERGGLDGYKVTLVLTSPDAFTLIETVKSGAPIRDSQRFVRATAAAKAP